MAHARAGATLGGRHCAVLRHKRKRKKVALCERQPLIRPGGANEVLSVDFVFDRVADGRSLKCLTVVDDATHEAVAIQPDTAISGPT